MFFLADIGKSVEHFAASSRLATSLTELLLRAGILFDAIATVILVRALWFAQQYHQLKPR